MSRVWALYWRAAEQRHWSLDGQAFTDKEAAERFKEKIVGASRGRSTVAEAMVLEYPSARDVRSIIEIGKKDEAVPDAPSDNVHAVPEPVRGVPGTFRKSSRLRS